MDGKKRHYSTYLRVLDAIEIVPLLISLLRGHINNNKMSLAKIHICFNTVTLTILGTQSR